MPEGSGVSGPALAEPAPRWRDLTIRVLSALVLLPGALLCVWAGGYLFLVIVAVAGLVLAHEWVDIAGRESVDLAFFWAFFWFPPLICAAVVLAGLGRVEAGLVVLSIGTLVMALLPAIYQPWKVFWRPRTSFRLLWTRPEDDAAGLVLGEHGEARKIIPDTLLRARFKIAFGVPYIGLAAVALLWLRADPRAGLANTLFVLAIVWGSDIGAYMVGRLAGGPKLAPAISPGKTWSGAAGGLVSAALAGLVVATCFSSGFSPSHVMELAIVLGFVSQAGDLLESMLKRRFGVKDSGGIIPGHGGLLDRVDALLAVAPAAALLALSVGRGVVLWR